MRVITETFDLMIDGKPVTVKATPYQLHTNETRYRVSINNSPVHIFGWSDDLNRLAFIDKGRAADRMAPAIDEAIGKQLYSRLAA
jgi:hypothetical protein